MPDLAVAIEKAYGFRIRTLQTIKHKKNSSYVAKITTSSGTKFAVKSLFLPKERQKFIALTEHLLSKKGVRLARPVRKKNGKWYFKHKGAYYVLYQWVTGKSHPIQKLNHLKSAVKTAAKLHRASYGLAYPDSQQIFSHETWLKDYRERLNSLKEWKKKHQHARSRKHRLILRNIPFFCRMGKKALDLLERSAYSRLASRPYSQQSVVHGDFHHNNIVVQGKRKFLIDFEDVRFDLPSKDLLRMFSMYTAKRPFRGSQFKTMIDTYLKFHPLPPDEKNVLLVDFLFPHIFERNLRKKEYVRMPYREARHKIAQEKAKIKFVYDHYFKD